MTKNELYMTLLFPELKVDLREKKLYKIELMHKYASIARRNSKEI